MSKFKIGDRVREYYWDGARRFDGVITDIRQRDNEFFFTVKITRKYKTVWKKGEEVIVIGRLKKLKPKTANLPTAQKASPTNLWQKFNELFRR